MSAASLSPEDQTADFFVTILSVRGSQNLHDSSASSGEVGSLTSFPISAQRETSPQPKLSGHIFTT